MTPKQLDILLEDFLTKFTNDVLVPLDILDGHPLLNFRPEELPRNHVYWRKRRKWIGKIRGCILNVLVNQPEIPDCPDYSKQLLAAYLNDLVNLFVRRVLGEVSVFHEDWYDLIFASTHPYIQRLDDFIYHETASLIEQMVTDKGRVASVPLEQS